MEVKPCTEDTHKWVEIIPNKWYISISWFNSICISPWYCEACVSERIDTNPNHKPYLYEDAYHPIGRHLDEEGQAPHIDDRNDDHKVHHWHPWVTELSKVWLKGYDICERYIGDVV